MGPGNRVRRTTPVGAKTRTPPADRRMPPAPRSTRTAPPGPTTLGTLAPPPLATRTATSPCLSTTSPASRCPTESPGSGGTLTRSGGNSPQPLRGVRLIGATSQRAQRRRNSKGGICVIETWSGLGDKDLQPCPSNGASEHPWNPATRRSVGLRKDEAGTNWVRAIWARLEAGPASVNQSLLWRHGCGCINDY